MSEKTKFCKHCGQVIDADCVVCPKCGKQVEELKQSTSSIYINNSSYANASAVNHVYGKKAKNKWISLALCIFTFFGHKFYEGKIGMGILYLLTMGIFGIGTFIDAIIILTKPNPYYV